MDSSLTSVVDIGDLRAVLSQVTLKNTSGTN